MLDTLYNTLSAGRTPGKQDFNASKMFSLLEDPFGIWCFFHAPKEESVNEINRYQQVDTAVYVIGQVPQNGVREGIEVLAPLMDLSKTDIVRLGAKLKVPFELTWSCYAGGKKPCGHCDSCKLRAKGFAEAGVHDTSLD